MSTDATTPTDNSRNTMTGTFQGGNRAAVGARGNPHPNNARIGELKRALIACGTVEDVQKLYAALMAAALDGDVPAAKLLLDHLVGRPTQPIEVTGTGPAPVQTDIRALVAIIHEETPDPEMRLRIARRILQLGQQTEVNADGPVDGDSPTA